MKNVSNEFISTSSERTDYYVLASVKFADGTKKELSRSDFYLSGNSYTDAAGSSSFPLGVALEKQMGISIVNDFDQWSTYDFSALNLPCTAAWIWTAEKQKRSCSARSRSSSRNLTEAS